MRVFMWAVGAFGLTGWAMKEMPLAQKRGSWSAPGICSREFGGEGAVHGRGVAADLLEHAAGHQRHDAAAAVRAVLLGAGPNGLDEAAGRLAVAAGQALGVVLDLLERGANVVAQMLEPQPGTLLPRRAEGLRQAWLFRCGVVHRLGA